MTGALLVAFGLGLASTLHCWGMCGGIAGAFTAAVPASMSASRGALLNAALLFNAGRVTSYTLAGGIAGALAAMLVSLPQLPYAYLALQVAAGLLLCLIGLQLGAWLPARFSLEQAVSPLWRRMQGALRRFVPMDSATKAFGAGLVWGWIPCGLVYSALAYSAAAADPVRSAAIMLAFGAGTLPGMIAAAAAAGALRRAASLPAVRRLVAVLLVVGGLGYAAVHVLSAAGEAHGPAHHHPATHAE